MLLAGLKVLIKVARKTGCTARELCVLVLLCKIKEADEAQRKLSYLTGMNRSNLSILLKKMEEKGLVSRDGGLRLTEEGKERVFAIADYYLAFKYEEKAVSAINKHLYSE